MAARVVRQLADFESLAAERLRARAAAALFTWSRAARIVDEAYRNALLGKRGVASFAC
jgi:hypothetical protein